MTDRLETLAALFALVERDRSADAFGGLHDFVLECVPGSMGKAVLKAARAMVAKECKRHIVHYDGPLCGIGWGESATTLNGQTDQVPESTLADLDTCRSCVASYRAGKWRERTAAEMLPVTRYGHYDHLDGVTEVRSGDGRIIGTIDQYGERRTFYPGWPLV